MTWLARIGVAACGLIVHASLPAVLAVAAALAVGCATPSTDAARSSAVSEFVIDLDRHPDLFFRIDSFVVPDAAREEFEAAMQRNMTFIRTLPGFRGHVVFEKRVGDSSFDIVTVAAWESRVAVERAGKEVRAYYQRIGFDMPGALKRWGVTLVRADYGAPARLQ